jgi:DNA-binding NtrC family response regulator
VRVQQKLPACKVLLFTGQAASNALVERAEREGHKFELLAKPIAPQLLVERIARSLGIDPSPVTN